MRESGAGLERPPSDFRIKDLREWHLVEGICWGCKRSGLIDCKKLMRGRNPELRLIDIEDRMRCTSCDQLGIVAHHTITVRMAPRN